MRSYAAVLFDMDGTLVDSDAAVERAWATWAGEWAVVTSADAPLATARLGAAGITPPLLVTVDDVRRGKPDPAGYLLAAARLGVDPARCLVVEDSEVGLAAGRAAGASTAALRGLAGDIRIGNLSDLF